MRGGAYAKVRDAGYIPRLKWLVESPRVVEGRLHSAKRDGKQKRGKACVSGGDGWRGREAARTSNVVTLETFHASRGWLKACALQKVHCTRQSGGKQE